jgi:hypothetical protein
MGSYVVMDFLDALVEQQKANLEVNTKTIINTKNGMLGKMQQNVQNSNQQKEWTTVEKKSTTKANNGEFAEASEKYLPLNLPKFVLTVYNKSPTILKIPITVTVRAKRTGSYSYNSTRILVAMLKALQMVHHDTYIGPINNDDTTSKKLTHHGQVSLDPVSSDSGQIQEDFK